VLFDYNTVRIAAVGNTSKVHVLGVIGESQVRAELLEAGLALVAVTVGVNQAANCGKVAGLELGDCGADLGDTADDLMSWYAWVDSGHRAPFITDLMEVRVTDTAEKDFDLNIVFSRIAPGNRSGGKG
jgi:hypothetical protein